MTADQFQRFAAILSNGTWCRHWLNYYCSTGPTVMMAIQCRDEDGRPQPIRDAKSHGLLEAMDFVYMVRRTNEDGTPYESKLP